MKVLLVEDEDNLRKFLKTILVKSGGFEVQEASSGADALALSEKDPVDVLVTDIVMGGMDGLALAHSMDSRNPNLGVVFISGHPIDFESQRAHFRRCAFLPKPFPPKALLDAIARVAV
jgi:two-component system cell cycle sensor histidine kinase/response regulator CckA